MPLALALRCLLAPALLALPLAAAAGNFGVSPIRIDLDTQARTGAVTVTNDDSGPLRLQVRLAEWTQDAEGRDVYKDSEELVYFPRLVSMGRDEQRLLRVGLRTPPQPREKTYRLFVEELPAPPEPGTEATSRVAIAVRFGVPVFLRPPQEQVGGEIERLEFAEGKLRMRVRNTGNVHFRILSITAQDDKGFATEAQGWYLLAGAAREHELPIEARHCAQLQDLSVVVKTDRNELRGSLPVDRSKCGG